MSPIRPILAAAGVTEAQWRVLRVLDESGPLDPATTAREACVLLPSLTRIVRDLELRGMITREPHASDRRTFWLNVTPQAQELIAQHMAQSEAVFAEIEARLGTNNLVDLLDLLDKLQDARPDDAPDQAIEGTGSAANS